MPASVARSGVTNMKMRLVNNFQTQELQAGLQPLPDHGCAAPAGHGSTWTNGCTSTLRHAPQCKYGSAFAHACASSRLDRKSTRLNSSHVAISYAVFCLKKKNQTYKH